MIDFVIINKITVGSTNEFIKTLGQDEKLKEGCVVSAQFQSAGKGQQGNSWVSEMGKNLLFSLYLQPIFLAPVNQFYLSKMVSIGICDALNDFKEGFCIKWPNDIYFGHKKIAGILIENTLEGNSIQSSILGVGLNVNQTSFSKTLPNPISLSEIMGNTIDIANLQNQILSVIEKRYDQLKLGEYKLLHDDYLKFLLGYNEYKTYRIGNRVFTAKIAGVKNSGELLLEIDGQIHNFDFKDIEYVFD